MTTTIRSFPIALLIAAFLLPATLLTAPAAAQSDADLRQENARLREELRELRKEYEQQRLRITELEREAARLRSELAARPASTGSGATTTPGKPVEKLPEPPVSIDESVPDASPRALFAALAASYRETLGATEIGEPNSRERSAYMRQLERWRQQVRREFRQRITWHVRVLETVAAPGGEEYLLRMVAVDPVTGTELGAHFDAIVDSVIIKRLRAYERRGPISELVLTGVVVPN
ncbi:MAG: hypothetical protein KC983_01135, partial [Phycisphaerales bacterium]|nr:hypothetical protein [Phycisphaerales bacterium]